MDAQINVRKLKILYAGDEVENSAKSPIKNKILKPIDFYKAVKKPHIHAGNYLQQK